MESTRAERANWSGAPRNGGSAIFALRSAIFNAKPIKSDNRLRNRTEITPALSRSLHVKMLIPKKSCKVYPSLALLVS